MGTRVSTVVAYSDFTSRSPDYALSKAGLFSSQTIIAYRSTAFNAHHFRCLDDERSSSAFP